MELEYKGYERNRTSEDSEFLLSANAAVQNFIDSTEPGEEVNVLDIGCGTQANFLKNLKEDPYICNLCNKKNIKLNLFGIAADSEPKPEDIFYYKQFLSATNGLECLPEGLQFDYIISSWCINYLGPNTFKKLLNDSIERLKIGGIIEFTPYHPTACSSAFPKALDFGEINTEIFPALFFEELQTEENIKKAKILIKGYMKILGLNKTPEQIKDYKQLSKSNDPKIISQIFIKHFYSSEKVVQDCYDAAFFYGIERFAEKEEIVSKILGNNDKYKHFVYHSGDSDVLNIQRKV